MDHADFPMGFFSKLFFFALGILGSHRDFPVATPAQHWSPGPPDLQK